MSKQLFQKGDHIKIAEDLGSSMSHFTSGIEAIVIGSYTDQYGGAERNEHEYTLHLKGHGQVSWYYEHQLTLIEKNRMDMLQIWEKAAADLKAQEMDLDWIFSPEHAVPDFQLPGNSAQALATELGYGSMWGPRGEGYVWSANYVAIEDTVGPFIRQGRRDLFEELKQSVLADPKHPRNKANHEEAKA